MRCALGCFLPSLPTSCWQEEKRSSAGAGCGSGEEPYTLPIIWRTGVIPTTGRDIPLRIIATDMNEELLERARQGRYPGSSLRYLPGQLREAFVPCNNGYSLRDSGNVEFLQQDIRRQLPEGTFHLILCRNLVFTSFAEGRPPMTRIPSGMSFVMIRPCPTELQASSRSVVRRPFFKQGRREGAKTLTANLISAEAGFIITANFISVAG